MNLPSPENIAAIAQSAVEVLGFIGAILAFWWKTGKAALKMQIEFEALKENTAKQFEDLKFAITSFATINNEMSRTLVGLMTKIDEREKDTMKLEGALDMQRRDMLEVIKGLQQASSSLDGLWRTLQVIHPDQVPRRASDRG